MGDMSTSLLIVYHSMTGGTSQMAGAAAEGAGLEPEIRVIIRRAQDASAADVLQAGGYLFACPENLAAMSGMMKDFFDRTYYEVLEQINGRPYALLICAGNDGSVAARQMTRIATGWRLNAVADPLIITTGAQTPRAILAPKQLAPEALDRCANLGTAIATGLALGIY